MTAEAAIERLAQARERFRAFVARRISDPDLAEDVLQSALVKASERIGDLRDDERLIPWFYAILRNAIVDAYRSDALTREVPLPPDFDLEDEVEVQKQLCECFEALLPDLKAEYAEVLDALDLRNEPAGVLATRLGITPNNLKVRHHRARQALRRSLQETCRVCADHHCLDCTCREDHGNQV